ncbi:hypothetical protein KIN_43750 [Litoreibacter roseus]|uniref:Uncharacterized protein n=1 Tax=Litoreibacter roseus TaxID=2601869 RepID=A0A6N6JLW6_9RHOB|nr:hypothetical protein KIN_43750 [Litoreibacter roseus]
MFDECRTIPDIRRKCEMRKIGLTADFCECSGLQTGEVSRKRAVMRDWSWSKAVLSRVDFS